MLAWAMKRAPLPIAVLTLALLHAAKARAATNLACVGDSITYGYGFNANESYPTDLQGLLGLGGATGSRSDTRAKACPARTGRSRLHVAKNTRAPRAGHDDVMRA